MKSTNKHTIFTGLTGDLNHEILDSVMGQLSDGMWENTPSMRKYWEHASIITFHGEVAIVIDRDWNSGFYGKDDVWVKSFFANKLKAVVKCDLEDNRGSGDWNRIDTTKLGYIGDSRIPVTVSDAYKVYDILKGRTMENKHYADDPVLLARKERQAKADAAIAEVEAEFKATLARLRRERDAL